MCHILTLAGLQGPVCGLEGAALCPPRPQLRKTFLTHPLDFISRMRWVVLSCTEVTEKSGPSQLAGGYQVSYEMKNVHPKLLMACNCSLGCSKQQSACKRQKCCKCPSYFFNVVVAYLLTLFFFFTQTHASLAHIRPEHCHFCSQWKGGEAQLISMWAQHPPYSNFSSGLLACPLFFCKPLFFLIFAPLS